MNLFTAFCAQDEGEEVERREGLDVTGYDVASSSFVVSANHQSQSQSPSHPSPHLYRRMMQQSQSPWAKLAASGTSRIGRLMRDLETRARAYEEEFGDGGVVLSLRSSETESGESGSEEGESDGEREGDEVDEEDEDEERFVLKAPVAIRPSKPGRPVKDLVVSERPKHSALPVRSLPQQSAAPIPPRQQARSPPKPLEHSDDFPNIRLDSSDSDSPKADVAAPPQAIPPNPSIPKRASILCDFSSANSKVCLPTSAPPQALNLHITDRTGV